MTAKSLVPKAAKQAGYDFNELVKQILVSAFGTVILPAIQADTQVPLQ
jgi:hypothetical protein